jgi:two-component system sensor histidine kinase/response regulator
MSEDQRSKILIVDDEPFNVELMEGFLSLTYDTIPAYNGEEALEKVKSEDPDLILLDVMMPGLNGFEVSSIIKSDRKTQFIPILMVTALAQPKDMEHGIEAGADDFLTKPVKKHEILARVRSLLRIKHMHDELHESENRYRELSEKLEIRVKERTAELEAMNQELEALTYSVAHDLRGPLRHMSGYAMIIKSKYKDILPQNAQEYLDKIQKSSIEMGMINDELIKLTEIGQKELNITSVRLNELVDESMDKLKFFIKDREIEWKIGELPEVECDKDLIKIVMYEILSNAIKFTNKYEHTVIEVSPLLTGRPGLMVKDNGIGFDMKYHDRVFAGFQRLHLKEDYEGIGVGLAFVHRIMKKHKGRVWAKAEENKGAAFFIEFPVLNTAI